MEAEPPLPTVDKVVVCGLGPESMEPFAEHASRFTTIGVNDCERFFTPDYLVVTDSIVNMKGDKADYVWGTKAKTVWLNRNVARFEHPDLRPFTLIPIGNTPLSDHLVAKMRRADVLLSWIMSPFSAVMLAIKMGAKNIGLMGVDLRRPCNLWQHANQVSDRFEDVRKFLLTKDVELVNLSPHSTCLDGLPYVHLEAF